MASEGKSDDKDFTALKTFASGGDVSSSVYTPSFVDLMNGDTKLFTDADAVNHILTKLRTWLVGRWAEYDTYSGIIHPRVKAFRDKHGGHKGAVDALVVIARSKLELLAGAARREFGEGGGRAPVFPCAWVGFAVDITLDGIGLRPSTCSYLLAALEVLDMGIQRFWPRGIVPSEDKEKRCGVFLPAKGKWPEVLQGLVAAILKHCDRRNANKVSQQLRSVYSIPSVIGPETQRAPVHFILVPNEYIRVEWGEVPGPAGSTGAGGSALAEGKGQDSDT